MMMEWESNVGHIHRNNDDERNRYSQTTTTTHNHNRYLTPLSDRIRATTESGEMTRLPRD
jgi:hypothetical protein